MAESRPLDLRHLALILDQGRQAAERQRDATLSYTLGCMAEAAAGYHQNDGGGVWNLEDDFAQLVERIGL